VHRPGEPDLDGRTVLLVEDDADSRDLFRYILESCGARVLEAFTALDALTMLDRLVPDALVSDLGLPAHDGLWLIDQIRRRPAARGGTVPAVAVTGFGREYPPERLLRLGFHRYTTKPVEPARLCALVREVLR
jgi:CheY-like chemotaxis protein